MKQALTSHSGNELVELSSDTNAVALELAERLAVSESLEHLVRFLEQRQSQLDVFHDRSELWNAYKLRFAAGARRKRLDENEIDPSVDAQEALLRLFVCVYNEGDGSEWLFQLAIALGRAWLESESCEPTETQAKEATLAIGTKELARRPTRRLLAQDVLDRLALGGFRQSLRALNILQLAVHDNLAAALARQARLLDDAASWW
ncbi:hypothetical protein ACFL5O_11620, partial [Myxococcota bacterium]